MQALALPPAIVFGHSMGAATAFGLAWRFPALVRALVPKVQQRIDADVATDAPRNQRLRIGRRVPIRKRDDRVVDRRHPGVEFLVESTG